MLVGFAGAKDPKHYQSGVLLQMESVECGFDENSGNGFGSEMLGVDAPHKKTRALLCQEYVLETDRIIYRIRPKDEKHPVLLPVGLKAQFRLDKDRLVLRVEDLDDKDRDYVVVSMSLRDVSKSDDKASAPNP